MLLGNFDNAVQETRSLYQISGYSRKDFQRRKQNEVYLYLL